MRRTSPVDGSRWVAAAAAAAGAASLAVTGWALLGGPFTQHAGWLLGELLGLCLLVAAAARWAPAAGAITGGGMAAAAGAVTVLRFLESASLFEKVAACAFYLLGPLVAGAVGLAGRWQRQRHLRAIAAARRAQRLELASDLHDFVAHDISEIIARAQAGQHLARQPDLVDLFRQIEQAGQRALSAMDRTVRVLRDRPDDGAAVDPMPGLDDLSPLVQRFADTGSAEVHLAIDDDATAAVSREAAATIHRIVVEALTNIRRHAAAARHVAVSVDKDRDGVRLVVTNDTGPDVTPRQAPPSRHPRRGGLGLVGLTERVHALGGSLHAGPHHTGWRLTAWLPTRGQP